MKKQILLNASLLVMLAVVFNSCSTSYEARRYSNLNYVKAGNPAIAQPPAADLKKNEIKPLKNKADVMQPSDFTASEKAVEPKQFSHIATASGKQPAVTNTTYDLQSFTKADIKKAVKAIVKDKKVVSSQVTKSDLMDNPSKLLLLWIILLGGSILFYILGAAAVSPGLYIIGGLLSLAAGVFFILWIVALVNNS